jgi:hypothetical protein
MKVVTRAVHGLLFWPTKKPNLLFYSVQSWLDKGCPNYAYVYDSADALTVVGIEIVDAYFFRGVWLPRAQVVKAQAKKICLYKSCLASTSPPKEKTRLDGIHVANPGSAKKMIY